jgi:hypothetical protein
MQMDIDAIHMIMDCLESPSADHMTTSESVLEAQRMFERRHEGLAERLLVAGWVRSPTSGSWRSSPPHADSAD